MLLSALLLATAAPAASPAACADRLAVYETWREPAAPAWRLDLAAASGGSLTYFGARHLRDPADPQFAAIEAAFAGARPTVVYFEGPDRGVGADAAETIRSRGESGHARFLAARAGIPVRSLEPGPAEEIAHLTQRFSGRQVSLFFILREVVRLRDLEVLQAAYGQAGFPGPQDWRQARGEWFAPTPGGQFTNAINRASSHYRDRVMFERLSQAALAGERVFAVVGRNHVAMQAEALTCALS
jgi:hypothetical protein